MRLRPLGGDGMFRVNQPFVATCGFCADDLRAKPSVKLPRGSGRARRYQLPNSSIRLQLSTMASFRPDGTLFEGHGVVADVAVKSQPTDLIGQADTALQKALELLR
ncbi:MAG: hypothetical protein ACI89X_004867 [Planctomycetota bacterium]|jgi:hypothetical protein